MEEDDNNKAVDLSGALDDSNRVVKFEGDQQIGHSYYPSAPKVIQWVIKYSGGYIKDEKRASYAILGFVVLAIIISLFLVFGGGGTSGNLGNPKDIEILPAVF